MFTNGGVGGNGSWDNCICCFVVNSIPLRDGYNCKDIVVPFDDVVVAVALSLGAKYLNTKLEEKR